MNYLQENQIFVAVINPYEMKKYSYRELGRIKIDNHNSITIVNFGIDNWFHLKNYESSTKTYSELKFLGRQYRHWGSTCEGTTRGKLKKIRQYP